MAKKAKKTASWRTLTRRADRLAREKQPTAAFALRRKAAELRRADRAAKGTKTFEKSWRETNKRAAKSKVAAASRGAKAWATRRANALKKAKAEGGLGALVANGQSEQTQGINREPSQLWTVQNAIVRVQHVGRDHARTAISEQSPGHGEIVGGADSQLAEKLVKLARKKGGKDAVQNEIMSLRQIAHYEGRVASDKAATARLVESQQILADRVICSFIAEIDATIAQYHGLPASMTFNVSSFIITKIIDALNKVGYRSTGKVNTGTVMGPGRGS